MRQPQPYYSPLMRGMTPAGGRPQGVPQGPMRPNLPPMQRTAQMNSQNDGVFRANKPPALNVPQNGVTRPAYRPMQPPSAYVSGATQGIGGLGGTAHISGDINGAGRFLQSQVNNPAAYGGQMAMPPEPTMNDTSFEPILPQRNPQYPAAQMPEHKFSRPSMNPWNANQQYKPTMPPVNARAPLAVDGVGAFDNTASYAGSTGLFSNLAGRPLGTSGQMALPPEAPSTMVGNTEGNGPPAISRPLTANSSFAATPDHQNDPDYRSMEQQQRNFQYKDQNLPRYQGNVDEINRQADVMQNTQLPDVNDPHFRGISAQEAYTQIPNNPYSIMRDRFSRIAAKQPPKAPPMTASQATSTMPNYGQRYADAEQANIQGNSGYTPVDVNAPAYSIVKGEITPRGSITPMPRKEGLTPQEAMRMQAVGSSIGEWKAKSDWLSKNGYQSMSDDGAAQKYAAEQQQKRFARNDQEAMAKQRDNMALDVDRQWRMRRRDQNLRYNNPFLYNTPDFTAAQLAYGMAGGDLKMFQQPGLTPQQAIDAQLRVRQQGLQQAQTQAALGMNAEAEQTIRGLNPISGFGGAAQQGAMQTDPRVATQRGQEHRSEDGTLNDNAFSTKLSSVLKFTPTAEGLVSQGINEADLEEFIYKNSGSWGRNSPSQQAKINEARRALDILRKSQPPQSQQPVQQQAPTLPPESQSDNYWPMAPTSY